MNRLFTFLCCVLPMMVSAQVSSTTIPYASSYDCPSLSVTTSVSVQSGAEAFGDGQFFKVPLSSQQTYVVHTTVERGQLQRNYSLLYDKTKKAALWVAYAMHGVKWGDNKAGRTNKWSFDPAIAKEFQPNIKYKSYVATDITYDRGHQMASGDRQNSKAANKQTFYFTNMTPQVSRFNRYQWRLLEAFVQKQTRGMMAKDTVYVVTGPVFGSGMKMTTDVDGKACPIPTGYFKTVVKAHFDATGKPTSAQGCAFYFAMNNYGKWQESVTSIDAIEAKTGFDFYANFPQGLIDRAEKNSSYDFF